MAEQDKHRRVPELHSLPILSCWALSSAPPQRLLSSHAGAPRCLFQSSRCPDHV